jgi:WD40 repeat protein/serine/threonine protein kinase
MMSDARASLPTLPLADFLRRLAQAEPDTWPERLRDDQRSRWDRGQLVRVEDYLDGLPELAEHSDALLDLIYGEVLVREAAGEQPKLAELQERFPEHREALARQWEVHLVLEQSSLRHTQMVKDSPPATLAPGFAGGKDLASRKASVFDTLPGLPPAGKPDMVIPGYDILKELGRGGNGVVYLARQRSLNRLVAIKMITPERSLTSAQVSRIRAEAELIARLQHSNIVSIYRVGLHEGKPYLVLEYVSGGSLADRLAGKPWPAADASALVETLARTLAVVHERGIVHRDLKPGNVLLTDPSPQPPPRSGEGEKGVAGSALSASERGAGGEGLRGTIPKIADFGLAKTLDEAKPPADRAVTQAGELIGTPLYMAPEQASGHNDRIGPATDQHALGLILYELLTGTLPFKADNAFDMLAHVAFTAPPPPSRRVRGISPDLDAIVLRCLAKEPAQRYANTLELAEDLYRVRQGFPSRTRKVDTLERMWLWSRRQPVVAALIMAVFLALLGGVATFALQWRRAEVALVATTAARAEAEESRNKEAKARKLEEDARKKESEARQEIQRKNVLLQEAFGQSRIVLGRSLVALAENERLRGNFARAEEHLALCPPEARAWDWRYLVRLCAMRLRTLEGPANDVFVSTAISPDGQWLAGAVAPGMRGRPPAVRLWAMGTDAKPRTLEGSAWVAFHPSGKWLATCKPAGGILLYTLSSLKAPPIVLGQTKDGGHTYNSVVFSPNGAYLAAQREDVLKVWQLPRTGIPRAPMSVELQPNIHLRAIAFRPDSNVLAVAARNRIRFWDVANRRFVQAPTLSRGKRKDPPRLAVPPDPKVILSSLAWLGPNQFVTGAADGILRVYDFTPTAVKQLFRLEGHAGAVDGLSAAGGVLASVSSDGTTRVWDVKNRQEVVRLPGFRTVALDAQGQRILSARRDRRLALWRARPTPPASPQTWHDAPVLALAFAPNSSVLATGSFDGMVSFHDPRPGHREIHKKWRAPGNVLALAYHPAGRLLATGLSRGAAHALVIRDVPSGRQEVLSGHPAAVAAVAFSPDGKLLASAGGGGVIHLWQGSRDDPAWKPLRKLEGHTKLVSGLAFGPRGMLASAARDGMVIVWNVETGKPLREVQVRPVLPERVDAGRFGMGLPFPNIAFSPDGKYVATAGRFGGDIADAAPGVVLVDVESGEERKLIGHTAGVESLSFSPDGQRLATSGRDGVVRLWDPHRGEEVLTLTGYTRTALAVAFSPDGRFLAASTWDKTVVVHDGAK